MKPIVFFLGCLLTVQAVRAQYTYFNILTGEPDDLESQSTGNVEVVEDGYVVWGGGVDDGVLFYFVRKYDFSGYITAENQLNFPDEYLYVGLTNSFRYNPQNQEFVMAQGSGIEGALTGRLLRFDQNLNLIDSRYYDEYYPYTYFFGSLIEENAYVVYGEIQSQNAGGTFLMKLDFEGNIIWNEVMEPLGAEIYRNRTLSPLDNGGYLVAGGGFSGGEPFARITLLDSSGNTLSVIEYTDPEEPRIYWARAAKHNNGDILVAQMIGYEDVEWTSNPDGYWTKVRLHKFDPETETFSGQMDFFDDHNFFYWSDIADIEPTPDGGAIILVNHPGFAFDNYALLLKVDSNLNQEWYQEYTYEECPDCSSIPYDIELAPDGGYIVAGWYVDYSIGVRNSTWLLKVDACGDVEWQGCEPVVGVEDAIDPERRSAVYPNPADDRMVVEPPARAVLVSYVVIDATGKRVSTGSGYAARSGIEVSGMAPGLYLLKLAFADGRMESHKVVVR